MKATCDTVRLSAVPGAYGVVGVVYTPCNRPAGKYGRCWRCRLRVYWASRRKRSW